VGKKGHRELDSNKWAAADLPALSIFRDMTVPRRAGSRAGCSATRASPEQWRNRRMQRAPLFCGGFLLVLVAECLLWIGPVWYAEEDSWFSTRSTRIIGVGLVVLGAEAAVVAAVCLARAFVPLRQTSAQSGMILSEPAQAPSWGRPVRFIYAILFFLGAVCVFLHAREVLHTLHVMEILGGVSIDIIDDFRFRAEVATTWQRPSAFSTA
jgi:hypothetical protein